MTALCRLCDGALDAAPEGQVVTGGLCGVCAGKMGAAGESSAHRDLLARVDGPVLLMQGRPRQVLAANEQALRLFRKERSEVEGRRGGEVFDCVNAFTEAGCGLDPNCEGCGIKAAVVNALEAGTAAAGVTQSLPVRTGDGRRSYDMEVAVERVGELALLRIDRYRPG